MNKGNDSSSSQHEHNTDNKSIVDRQKVHKKPKLRLGHVDGAHVQNIHDITQPDHHHADETAPQKGYRGVFSGSTT